MGAETVQVKSLMISHTKLIPTTVLHTQYVERVISAYCILDFSEYVTPQEVKHLQFHDGDVRGNIHVKKAYSSKHYTTKFGDGHKYGYGDGNGRSSDYLPH